MKILQVVAYYPPHLGGLERHVEGLSRKLVEAGHQVTVFTANVPKMKATEAVDGVEVRRFRCLATPLANPITPGLLCRLLDSDEFDIVHTHVHYHMCSTMAVLSNVAKRRPLVLTCHGLILGYHGWKRVFESAFNRSIGRWTFRSVDKVIVLTPTLAEMVQHFGVHRDRIVVIPGWVELVATASQADPAGFRSGHGFGDRKLVLFVGRLLPAKGLGDLIEAASHSEARPVVAIVGDEAPGYAGTREVLVQQVKRLGLEDQVFFLGGFGRAALESAYEAADLFVLPSLGEGLPMVLLEAMAHGKCVLATDVVGNRDVVKDGVNGVLMEARNPTVLAQRMDTLLGDDSLRARLGAQARSDVEHYYSPDVVLSELIELYHKVCGS